MRKATFAVIAAGLVAAVLLAAGCAGLRPPKGPLEQIELAEISAQQAARTIAELTCTKYVAKKCVEPGKVFDAELAAKLYESTQEARQGLRAARALGSGEVGQCLGQARTQQACIGAVRLLLNQLERQILEKQAAQGGA